MGLTTVGTALDESKYPATVTITPAEPLYRPLGTRARRRTKQLGGKFSPLSSQPPTIRVPDPSALHVVPRSTDTSKATPSTSGEAPPRSHSIRLALGRVRLCV